MEVKIQIPDNCELIKDGNTYVVKEKKDNKPRSWEEFCKNYPVKDTEYYIDGDSIISNCGNHCRHKTLHRSMCTSKQEAEAFLALMQLRRLREEWVKDTKFNSTCSPKGSIIVDNHGVLSVSITDYHLPLSFPTMYMANEFLYCFKDLCETAKILL